MKLYSGSLSLFTGKVRIALDEKGLEYDIVSVPFSRAGYQPKHPDVLAINPKAQVPVLVDGPVKGRGRPYDPPIIREPLEAGYPGPPLSPLDVAERARCRQLEAAADEVLFPHVYELILEVFYKPAPERDAERIARAHAGIARHYDELERDLAGRDYLCSEFSVADIGYFMTVTFAANF